jgi:hypothetical protein
MLGTYDPMPADGNTTWGNWLRGAVGGLDSRATALESAGGVSGVPGYVTLDSFQTGSLTDDQLLTDAMTYMQAQTYRPTLVLGNRLHTFTTTGRVPFNGMRIIGSTPGPKNPEIAAALGGSTAQINVGTGTSSWWNGNGADRYDIYFGDLTITSTNAVSQFWHQSINTLYACEFHSLTFYGLQHIFGTPSAKALFTQVQFTGHWTSLGAQDVQFTVGGADNNLWLDNRCNLQANTSVAGADRYQLVIDNMDKSNVGAGLYCTAENNWRGVKVIGSGSTRTLNFWGPIIEGRAAGTPCVGTLLRIESHNVKLWGVRFAFAMSAPDAGENGVVEVTGGDVSAWGCMYERATGVAETVPMFYCSAGRCSVKEAKKQGTWTGLPRVDEAGGTVPASDGTWTLI